MEDELWLKKIKDKLEDYSEPLPVADIIISNNIILFNILSIFN